ncbi:hypothetical protein OHQ88_33935 (plasmid) [Micromonospora zamorensis]|uniref:hypothetical protein n=1 Tax=Micromonospora zamorensis TaxID=709883 RepID=UPI002E1D2953
MIANMAVRCVGGGVTNAALAVALLVTASSCSSGEPTPAGSPPRANAPSSPPAGPSPGEPAETAAARTAALAAYNGYREAHIVASAKGDAAGRDLAHYAAGQLLSETRYALTVLRDQNLITVGRPNWDAKVKAVNATARPFSAQIEDCFDGTNWNTIHKDTKKSAAVEGQARRYVVTADVRMYDDGRWLVQHATAHRDRPC